MAFFKTSFNSFGETLRTVSLAIGLLVTSATGVGYIYSLISEQKAMATTLSVHDKRIGILETEQTKIAVDRWRLENVEKVVTGMDTKLDKFYDTFSDFRERNSR